MAVTDYSGNLDLDVEDDPNEAGGSMVSIPGWYHLRVKSIEDNEDDQLAFKSTVLASTNPNQEGNIFNAWINTPDGSNKDGGKFAFRIIVRLARSMNLKNCQTQKPCLQMKPGDKFAVDWDEAEGKELIVFIRERDYTKKNGDPGKQIEIEGLKMFHVSDKEVKDAGLKIAKTAAAKKPSKAAPKEGNAADKPAPAAPAEKKPSSSLDGLI